MIIFLGSCTSSEFQNTERVVVFFEGSVNDGLWDRKGYEGLQRIKEKYDVETFYEEDIQTENEIMHAVEKHDQKGVNLIFGHGSLYGRMFVQLADDYPHIHFVYFNDSYVAQNVTSINFKFHAMGFFSGMVASKMSNNNHVGIMAAHKWQLEIEGFYEGVKFQDPMTKVHIKVLSGWQNPETIVDVYEDMRKDGVDVVYPASDHFSQIVIEKASEDNIYTIGYLDDQLDLDPSTVLTSTVQEIEKIYPNMVDLLNQAELKGGIRTFDFADGFISLGEYSQEIPKPFQKLLQRYLKRYEKLDLLPNEQ